MRSIIEASIAPKDRLPTSALEAHRRKLDPLDERAQLADRAEFRAVDAASSWKEPPGESSTISPVNQQEETASQEAMEGPETGATKNPWVRRAGVALFLVLAVAFGTYIRVQMAVGDPAFDTTSARPLLKSDPGLLYYITERIVDAGGLPPSDFRADPNIEHPATSDIPAMFSVGQEFIVAWTYLLFGDGKPLHMVALWIMSIFASLTVIGVFGMAYEIGRRSVPWGIVGACFYLVLLGNYRTIGFMLIREDFSIPWLSLHLYFLMRAVRVRSVAAIAASAFFFTLAAATWHAMSFMLTIESAVAMAWFLRSGQNPMAHPKAWIFPAIVALGSLLVPVLWAKGFLLSLPMLVIVSLWLAAWLARKKDLSTLMSRAAAPGALLILIAVSAGVALVLGGGRSDYSHVFELMSAKLEYMGTPPSDPLLLSFDTRLLWQGPFATPDWVYFEGALGACLIVFAVALVWGAYGWIRGQNDSRLFTLIAFSIGGIVAALLVQRTVVLPALLGPVVAVAILERLRNLPARWVCGLLFMAFQSTSLVNWVQTYQSPWYQPAQMGQELAEVVTWVEQNIPANEPICSDFLTGTAVLAHCGNPMLIQPKYETTSSRRRIETFTDTFMNGTMKDFRTLLAENDCRYVLTNQDFWRNNAYIAGIEAKPGQMPDPKTPYFNLCHPDIRVSQGLQGFQLIFSSPNLFGRGVMRVYRKLDAQKG